MAWHRTCGVVGLIYGVAEEQGVTRSHPELVEGPTLEDVLLLRGQTERLLEFIDRGLHGLPIRHGGDWVRVVP